MSRKAAASQFTSAMRRSNEIHAKYLGDSRLHRNYRRFTQWQVGYLLQFAAEIYAQPGYRDAVDFAVNEFAGAGVIERDRQLARVAGAVTTVLPTSALRTIATAATVNENTLSINLGVCRELSSLGDLPDPITERDYFLACRAVSSIDEFKSLLTQTTQLGVALEAMVRSRWTGITLKAMSAPARTTGFGALQMFFESGYQTFRDIPDVDYFLGELNSSMSAAFKRIFDSPI